MMPDAAWLREQFERCLPFLQPAIDRAGGAYDAEYVWDRIADETVRFWPYRNSAVVTRVEQLPNGERQIYWWLAGGDLDEILAMHDPIIEWARGEGCTRSEMVCRRGFAKPLKDLDYQETAVTLTRRI